MVENTAKKIVVILFFSNSRLFCNHSYYMFIALLFCNPKSQYSGLCAIITMVLFSHCVFSLVNFNYHSFYYNPQTSATNPQLQVRSLVELLIQKIKLRNEHIWMILENRIYHSMPQTSFSPAIICLWIPNTHPKSNHIKCRLALTSSSHYYP